MAVAIGPIALEGAVPRRRRASDRRRSTHRASREPTEPALPRRAFHTAEGSTWCSWPSSTPASFVVVQEERIRTVIDRILAEGGIQTTAASSGGEVLELFERAHSEARRFRRHRPRHARAVGTRGGGSGEARGPRHAGLHKPAGPFAVQAARAPHSGGAGATRELRGARSERSGSSPVTVIRACWSAARRLARRLGQRSSRAME